MEENAMKMKKKIIKIKVFEYWIIKDKINNSKKIMKIF